MTKTCYLALALASVLASACTWFDVRDATASEAANGDTREPGADSGTPSAGAGGAGIIIGRAGGDDGTGGVAAAAGSHAVRPPAGEGGMSGGTSSSPGPDGGEDECDGGCQPAEQYEPDFTWHPAARRFAITDESIDAGTQGRVWLVTDGDATNRLMSLRLSDSTAAAWIDTGITGVTSSPAAVSFASSGAPSQWLFFVRKGRLHMLVVDEASTAEDGGAGAPYRIEQLASPQLALNDGNLAAMTFFAGEDDRRVAVLVPGVDGGYCVHELTVNDSAWNVQCASTRVMHPATDVVAAVIGDEAHFYFRSPANGLSRLARTSAGGYALSSIATPYNRPIAQSLVAIPSELEGRVELIVIAGEGELWYARPLASERIDPQWTQFRLMQRGVRASMGPAALAAIVTENFSPLVESEPRMPDHFKLTELRVIGDDGELYQTVTDRYDPSRPWWLDWFAVPPNGHDQRALALGGIIKHPLALSPIDLFELANSLAVVGGRHATTLQDAPTLFSHVYWRDRLRVQEPVRVPSLVPPAELASAAGGDYVILAAAQRSSTPPFGVTLFGSADGATSYWSWPLQSHAVDAPNAMSVLQPVVRYGGGRFHLAALERATPTSCVESFDQLQRITYRSASDAAALAALQPGEGGYHVVRSELGYLAHPALAVTEGRRAGATAHLVFNAGTDRDLFYWQLGPFPASEPVEAPIAYDMPDGPPVLATGFDDALYVASADSTRFEVCQLPPSGEIVPSGCSVLSMFALPDARELYFGAPLDSRYGACAGDAPPYYACFRDDRPFSIAVDTATTFYSNKHRLLVAYAAADGPATSIYVTSSRGGDSLAGDPASPLPEWTPPLRIHSRALDDTRHYFDAEVTIDSRRIVTITYSAIDSQPSAKQLAHAYITRGLIDQAGDVSYLSTIEVGTWSPASLPMDCASGRAALGAYREPERTGARTLHVLREGTGLNSRWLSEYVSW